ncbi:stomatin-4 isoform X1 [Drosophila biarmipes]|uniref:stomatin-4 isoform X1 n=1 Tax=Drosophila biarmipes TaxID=125945 RepID=UPI0007E6C231|nr:stomatin-4 isoform X1 [Drosophila biarmipes]
MNNKQTTSDPALLAQSSSVNVFHDESILPQRNVKTSESVPPSCAEKTLFVLSMILIVLALPWSIFCCLRVMSEYERAVILRLGRLRPKPPRGPGVIFLVPCLDEIFVVDIRTKSFDLDRQEILTRDMVTISIDGVVYYSIKSPFDAILQVFDSEEATEKLAMTTLRNVAGIHKLMDLLSSKEYLSNQIEGILYNSTEPWGVRVERVEIDFHAGSTEARPGRGAGSDAGGEGQGGRRPRREGCGKGAKGGRRHYGNQPHCPATAIPTNPELHLQRRYQILRFSFPRRYCEETYEIIGMDSFEKFR